MSQTSKKEARQTRGKKGKLPEDRPEVENAKTSNQYIKDPRQALFIVYYLDPKSKTFSNAFRSALKAGYKEQYAKMILSRMPGWLQEKVNEIKDGEMIKKAEKNLEECMDMEVDQPVISMFGPIDDGEGGFVKKPNVGILKIKQDTSKFVAERLNRSKYGQKVAVIGDPDNPLEINIVTSGAKYGIKK